MCHVSPLALATTDQACERLRCKSGAFHHFCKRKQKPFVVPFPLLSHLRLTSHAVKKNVNLAAFSAKEIKSAAALEEKEIKKFGSAEKQRKLM